MVVMHVHHKAGRVHRALEQRFGGLLLRAVLPAVSVPNAPSGASGTRGPEEGVGMRPSFLACIFLLFH